MILKLIRAATAYYENGLKTQNDLLLRNSAASEASIAANNASKATAEASLIALKELAKLQRETAEHALREARAKADYAEAEARLARRAADKQALLNAETLLQALSVRFDSPRLELEDGKIVLWVTFAGRVWPVRGISPDDMTSPDAFAHDLRARIETQLKQEGAL